MSYANQDFSAYKNSIFQRMSSRREDIEDNIGSIEASSIDYRFILKNLKALELDFLYTFAALQKQRERNVQAFWMYSLYLAYSLREFYRAYGHDGNVDEYDRMVNLIKRRLRGEEEAIANEEAFLRALRNSYLKIFKDLWAAKSHPSQIREYIGFYNLLRVYWVFTRLTFTSGLSLAYDSNIIAQIDARLGTNTDVTKIIEFVNIPNGVLSYLSVGFFLIHFAVDFGQMIRHTFFPNEAEKANGTTRMDRFMFEFDKRHTNFLNDLWALPNLENIYADFFGAYSGGIITAIALVGDLLLTLYQSKRAEWDFLNKEIEYTREKKEHEGIIVGLYDNLADLARMEPNSDEIELLKQVNEIHVKIEFHRVHIAMREAQLKEAQFAWLTKKEMFNFCARAAGIMLIGFSATLLFTPPGIAVASFFACTLATAMYLSAGSYAKYQEKSLWLADAQKTGQGQQLALKEYQIARNHYYYTMIKNAILPTLVITAVAIYWPLAVAVAALAIIYAIYHAYDQHKSNNEAKLMTIPKLPDEITSNEAGVNADPDADPYEGADPDEDMVQAGCFRCFPGITAR